VHRRFVVEQASHGALDACRSIRWMGPWLGYDRKNRQLPPPPPPAAVSLPPLLCGMKLPLPIVARVWRAEDANDGSGEDG
jgi:hypothetical protein